jgi:alkanesulfonate monooxygenase SsuD/methylene tetrahydromethanopterin reductase-like flavin-dependent oxidoreductase (luciferase family)
MEMALAPAKAKLGILLPTRGLLLRPAPARDAELVIGLARKVEAAGLDSVWVGDSLTAKPRLEPLATLAAVAACTERVRLGTAVLLAALRHPILLAQTLATVDLISKGRLVLGAGVGGAFNDEQRAEWRAAGVDPKRRAGRMEEILQIVQQLGKGDPVTFSGNHFCLDQVRMEPLPVQPGGVPLLLASHWRAKQDAQLARTARLADGLVSISDTPEEYARLVQRVHGMMSASGRDSNRCETAFYMTVNINSDRSKADAEATDFLTRYYGTNIWGDRWGPFGDWERIQQRMAEYVEAGAETLIVRFASFDPEAQLETFLDRVAPAFSASFPK